MVNRKVLGTAACAALACAGLVRAEEAPATSTTVAARSNAPAFTLVESKFLAEESAAVEAPPARKPLMALLHMAGLAEPLESARIGVFGHVEASTTFNFDDPADEFNNGRVFDFEDSDPTLNQIDIAVERTVEVGADSFDVGGRMEWIWGGDARGIHSLGLFDHYGFFNVPFADDADSPDEQFDLHQLYLDVALPVGKGLRIRAGKFTAFHGWEVINPTGNAFYSHSYLFGFAIPFTHTGIFGTYALTDALTVDAGITRGWDTSLEDNNDAIDILGRVTYVIDADSSTNAIVSVISGPEQTDDNGNWRTVVDLILSTKVGDDLTLALNGDYGYEANSASATPTGTAAKWYGLAGYASYALSDMFTLNGRVEWFSDNDGARLTGAVGGCDIYEATVGVSIKPFADNELLSGLVIRPELRYDYCDENFFDGLSENDQITAAIEGYFAF